MSIEIPHKKHRNFTKKIKHLQANNGKNYTWDEKEEIYVQWENSYNNYLKKKYSLKKIDS